MTKALGANVNFHASGRWVKIKNATIRRKFYIILKCACVKSANFSIECHATDIDLSY